MKKILSLLLLVFATSSLAEVQYDPRTGLWFGNTCYDQYSGYQQQVQWQPIGSFCAMRLPNGQVIQGMIVNDSPSRSQQWRGAPPRRY